MSATHKTTNQFGWFSLQKAEVPPVQIGDNLVTEVAGDAIITELTTDSLILEQPFVEFTYFITELGDYFITQNDELLITD